MLKFLKKTFSKTNDCIILITPLIIFLSIFSWYLNYSRYSINSIGKLSLFLVTSIVMVAGLLSAWFYMLKKSLVLSDKTCVTDNTRGQELLKILCSFPRGVGKYFLSFLGVCVIFTTIYLFIFWISTILVSKFVGVINLDLINSNNTLVSGADLLNKLKNLSQQDLIIMNTWLMIFDVFSSVVLFILMFWMPELIYKTNNAIKSLFLSIKKLFKTFPKALLLCIYLKILYFLISVLHVFALIQPVLLIFVLLLFYYYVLYAIISIFLLYKQEFSENE